MLIGLILSVATGCVSIPESSAPVSVTELPMDDSLSGDTGIQVRPLAPRDGQQPDEVVRGFLAASASTERGRSTARQYLSPASLQEWSDDAGVTVIDRDYAAIAVDDGARVELTGRIVGQIDAEGVYTVAPGELRLILSMLQVDGEWRIENPPPGVILTSDDFARSYTQTNLYFLDPTGTLVVPDPRYFLAGSVARANTLVEALLAGPSDFLAPAVRTELGEGVELVSNVQERRDLRIELSGLGERSPASLQGLSAQLVWTLKQLSISSLRITADGQALSVPEVGVEQEVDDWQLFDPDAVPADAVGHYVGEGAVWTANDGERIPGPAGDGTYTLTTAGATADQTRLAGISQLAGTSSLLVGEYGGELVPIIDGPSFTAPSWAGATQELWTVRGGSEVLRVPTGAAAQVVSTPTLAALGAVRVLQLSRDGTRAALVIEGAETASLYVARLAQTGTTVQMSGFTPITPTLSGVLDVSWSSADDLLLIADDPAGGGTRPWRVSVDGSVLTEETVSGLRGQPTAVAAAPGRAPLVTAGGTMWRLDSNTWLTLVRGQPLIAGAAPFYPG